MKTKNKVKEIAIKITTADPRFVDFEISVDGKPDGNLYRQYTNEKKFSKLLGLPNTWSKAVRGKTREAAQQLLDNMLKNACPLGRVEL